MLKKKEFKSKTCTACHKELPLSHFYVSKSPLHSLDGKVPICKDCVISNSLKNDNSGEIDEDKFKNILRQLDKPFYKDTLQSSINQFLSENSFIENEIEAKKHGEDILKKYFKNVNSLRQLSNKNYLDSEKDNFIQKHSTVLKTTNKKNKTQENNSISTQEIEWSDGDKQNIKYVISTIGYDPFQDMKISDFDKRYCFNILASYCDLDGISEDGHKIRSVIEISLLYSQCKKITEAIDLELKNQDFDETKISKLTMSKSNILSSIAKIAQDNNISSNYNKNSKQGKNSFTSKMREMEENDFAAIKVNLFDIKTSEAFKQIDNISNQNIATQLTLDSNDYSDMVKEQRELILKYENEILELREENRNLKNKIIYLENK